MLPAVRGVIDRRILANYRVEPDALREVLPEPFEPQTVDGWGVGGICLIRLVDERPRYVPPVFGTTSENAAHRIAVEWEEDGERRSGVYVPRRDSDSRLNTLLGGRLFAGDYHRASFDSLTAGDRYAVSMHSDDGEVSVSVAGTTTDALPDDSVFGSVAEASEFFREGSVGFSPGRDGYDAIELCAFEWAVTPLSVESVESSFFEEQFPSGAVAFDDALLMTDIAHEWRERESVCV